MQGVEIGIFVNRAPSAKSKTLVIIPAHAGIQPQQKSRAAENACAVHHADLYGTRTGKYANFAKTIRLQAEIDAAIPAWPLQ